MKSPEKLVLQGNFPATNCYHWTYDVKEACLVGFSFKSSLGKFISIIAKVWNDRPETLHWLKNNIKLYPSLDIKTQPDLRLGAEVRAASLQELANAWKSEPDILPILKACAQYEYKMVQCVAILELAKIWKKDPDCLSIIKKCAKFNDDLLEHSFFARDIALWVLSEYWKDEPRIFEFLYECALSDPFDIYPNPRGYPNPRQRALSVILKNYPDHLQTLALLRDRAKNDPDQNLREFAQNKLKELENQG